MLLVAVFVLAQAGGAPAGARPQECGALDGGRGANVWERAKAPELRRYCDRLASGAAKLAAGSSMAEDVLAIADDADQAIPGRAAPRVLRGRALARLGRYADALAALRDAKERDDRALDDPAALLAWARALAETGNASEAMEAYRSLLPRASALVSADRGAAYVAAGELAMARGPLGLDEAVAILRQARRESQDVVQAVAMMALALALDRAGDKAEARAVLLERSFTDARVTVAEPRAKDALGPAGTLDGYAMTALALEATNAKAARESWQVYLDAGGAKTAWAEHARGHVAPGAKRPVPSRRGE